MALTIWVRFQRLHVDYLRLAPIFLLRSQAAYQIFELFYPRLVLLSLSAYHIFELFNPRLILLYLLLKDFKAIVSLFFCSNEMRLAFTAC